MILRGGRVRGGKYGGDGVPFLRREGAVSVSGSGEVERVMVDCRVGGGTVWVEDGVRLFEKKQLLFFCRNGQMSIFDFDM